MACSKTRGPNSRSARRITFTSTDDVARLEDTVRSYLVEAIAVEESGLELGPAPDLVLIEELRSRLDDDPALEAAFEALTPGRRREYNLYFSSAQKTETAEVTNRQMRPEDPRGQGSSRPLRAWCRRISARSPRPHFRSGSAGRSGGRGHRCFDDGPASAGELACAAGDATPSLTQATTSS